MSVEVRKPFVVIPPSANVTDDRWRVVCEGKPSMPVNTCLLITFFTEDEAQKLANALNEAFANYFDM